MTPSIRNQRAPMQYRRFGRTEKHLSVITLGGMRYAGGWDRPRGELPKQTIENCRDCVMRALDAGINHIETAWGYIKSEHAYGKVLNEELAVPRDRYHLMTKSVPKSADDARKAVELQLKALQTDYLDFYAWHGLNDQDCLETATAAGGPVEELNRMVEEGLIGHVGFSTHGPSPIIEAAIATDLFSFVNLHYYYFFQTNRAAVQAAAARDMGVFIISPNDKGGRLYDPPPLLSDLCAPATPIQWNARFCLGHPQVHTLSFGMTAAEHFQEMLGVLPAASPICDDDQRILARLDARLDGDPAAHYDAEHLRHEPSGINVPEVLRLRRMWKCYDMEGYARYRYNMFGTQGHWYPGRKADEAAIAEMDVSALPQDPDIQMLLRETHAALTNSDAPESGH